MKTYTVRPQLPRRANSYGSQLIEAYDFFSNPNLSKAWAPRAGDNPYADKDGLIEFFVGVELIDNPAVMQKLTELKKYLVSITSVVTSYVNRYAEHYQDPKFKTDADLWALALSKIPLMGPSKLDEQTYSKHIKGVSIAVDFVNFVLEIVASEGSSALTSFSKFLEKQGEALKFGVEKNADYYRTITVGVAVEVFTVGETIFYVPKVKQFRVNFTRENTKWSSACASAEWVDINFAYTYGASVFDYEALEDPDIKADFEKFIKGSQKAQIEDATTFFDADFPPLPKSASARHR
jgi:hypothetical protein